MHPLDATFVNTVRDAFNAHQNAVLESWKAAGSALAQQWDDLCREKTLSDRFIAPSSIQSSVLQDPLVLGAVGLIACVFVVASVALRLGARRLRRRTEVILRERDAMIETAQQRQGAHHDRMHDRLRATHALDAKLDQATATLRGMKHRCSIRAAYLRRLRAASASQAAEEAALRSAVESVANVAEEAADSAAVAYHSAILQRGSSALDGKLDIDEASTPPPHHHHHPKKKKVRGIIPIQAEEEEEDEQGGDRLWPFSPPPRAPVCSPASAYRDTPRRSASPLRADETAPFHSPMSIHAASDHAMSPSTVDAAALSLSPSRGDALLQRVADGTVRLQAALQRRTAAMLELHAADREAEMIEKARAAANDAHAEAMHRAGQLVDKARDTLMAEATRLVVDPSVRPTVAAPPIAERSPETQERERERRELFEEITDGYALIDRLVAMALEQESCIASLEEINLRRERCLGLTEAHHQERVASLPFRSSVPCDETSDSEFHEDALGTDSDNDADVEAAAESRDATLLETHGERLVDPVDVADRSCSRRRRVEYESAWAEEVVADARTRLAETTDALVAERMALDDLCSLELDEWAHRQRVHELIAATHHTAEATDAVAAPPALVGASIEREVTPSLDARSDFEAAPLSDEDTEDVVVVEEVVGLQEEEKEEEASSIPPPVQPPLPVSHSWTADAAAAGVLSPHRMNVPHPSPVSEASTDRSCARRPAILLEAFDAALTPPCAAEGTRPAGSEVRRSFGGGVPLAAANVNVQPTPRRSTAAKPLVPVHQRSTPRVSVGAGAGGLVYSALKHDSPALSSRMLRTLEDEEL